ncbi:MAG: hypothetical protein GOU99_00605 [Candidatus Altiarchaeota archaeon]|nr:hypothetical protein [Candidatus Altiarchaeota archaeon]
MDWIDKAKKIAERAGYKRVLVHLPAGLMDKWPKLNQLADDVLFWSDPCFGACDVPLYSLEILKADAIFSFGHSTAPSIEYPKNIHIIEIYLNAKLPEFVPDFERIGLVYVIQYKQHLQEYKDFLESKQKIVVLGGKPDFMAKHTAQVTGCDIGAAQKIAKQVDGFVVMSDGSFHTKAVAELGKPVFNWLGEQAEKIKKNPTAMVIKAKKIGVLVSTKPGQFDIKNARKLAAKLKKSGKNVVLVVGNTVSSEITNFGVDLWINTACPRLVEDEFIKPALKSSEIDFTLE